MSHIIVHSSKGALQMGGVFGTHSGEDYTDDQEASSPASYGY